MATETIELYERLNGAAESEIVAVAIVGASTAIHSSGPYPAPDEVQFSRRQVTAVAGHVGYTGDIHIHRLPYPARSHIARHYAVSYDIGIVIKHIAMRAGLSIVAAAFCTVGNKDGQDIA